MTPRSTAFLLALALALPATSLAADNFEMRSTIAFSSTRDNLDIPNPTNGAEIYLCDPDFTNVRRLTQNTAGEFFATLSPDGKKIVFDSMRNRPPGVTGAFSDLFLMDTNGDNQTFILHGSSATWSPDSKVIAYHASASGTGTPIRGDFGAPATDSDLFTLNLDDWLAGTAVPVNITNTPDVIEDDADWSPDGQTLVFTGHPTTDSPTNAFHQEIYRINRDGTGLTRLTNNLEEERAPSWSPDGSKITCMSRRGGLDFEIITMDADGSNQLQLTDNSVSDATSTWSPDGQKIVFHRVLGGTTIQLFEINANGTGEVQMTTPPTNNGYANWGELRVKVKTAAPSLAQTPSDGDGLTLRLASQSPARGGMSFRFAVPAAGTVRLAIYDIQGRLVAKVLDQTLQAGWWTETWDGRDLKGRLVASGGYFAKLEAGGEVQLQKLLVAR
jgi:TolB protein